MDLAPWSEIFRAWPASLPRRGIVVTTLNEQVPFADFLISDHLLLLDRPTPDTMGGRKVMLPFSQIAALKITDVVKNSLFVPMGFASLKPAPAPAQA
jgi:hypothetical protein